MPTNVRLDADVKARTVYVPRARSARSTSSYGQGGDGVEDLLQVDGVPDSDLQDPAVLADHVMDLGDLGALDQLQGPRVPQVVAAVRVERAAPTRPAPWPPTAASRTTCWWRRRAAGADRAERRTGRSTATLVT
jgi:hypothetical protein